MVHRFPTAQTLIVRVWRQPRHSKFKVFTNFTNAASVCFYKALRQTEGMGVELHLSHPEKTRLKRNFQHRVSWNASWMQQPRKISRKRATYQPDSCLAISSLERQAGYSTSCPAVGQVCPSSDLPPWGSVSKICDGTKTPSTYANTYAIFLSPILWIIDSDPSSLSRLRASA